jgi:hypothetical protein
MTVLYIFDLKFKVQRGLNVQTFLDWDTIADLNKRDQCK